MTRANQGKPSCKKLISLGLLPKVALTNHTNHLFISVLQVDFMLGSYMEDIGITAQVKKREVMVKKGENYDSPQEFEAACSQGKSITGKFHQQLFEQVYYI